MFALPWCAACLHVGTHGPRTCAHYPQGIPVPLLTSLVVKPCTCEYFAVAPKHKEYLFGEEEEEVEAVS